ncbi:glycoside hydrolase family 95 protein [Mucilaginibacter flavidus]|uniref:glycoside hydrolase family 95 protein n=1 Tax=Mucilaginibacter flavidus TaxID=2949309 RepID=UPI0020929BAA|nr:glycoside hydrolase family 95 protein [Mucilaginibacter flavidus]MCO5951188.1 glycoside hydrolase family 95 protein [Mucilaginibacter flavidus]
MINVKSILIMCVLLATTAAYATDGKPGKLWYKQPAKKWDAEALPIGNGRMGAMLFGGIKTEHIQFNEQSLWGGDNNWDGDYETGDHGFGSYRNFGEVVINFDHADIAAAYQRMLNISTGVHTTSFSISGVRFEREAFASKPDQMMVFKYTASKKAALSGSIALASAQGAASIANNGELSFAGEMPNHLKYAASLRVEHQGGVVTHEGNTLIFKNCSSLLIYLDARTNYKPDYRSDWRGTDPMPLIQQEQKTASQFGYQKLLDRHIKDITRLTGAATIVIGKTGPELLALPTDIRLKKYASGGNDPGLEEAMFQYGRYLLISSSRPGGLPANLQGLWNNSNTPPWAGDYHNNINIQMNYWSAESTNLSECHLPLIDFIVAAEEACRIATRKAFGQNTRGWTARTSQSIFGGNGWEWNIPASAWYAHHVFEHWAFTTHCCPVNG